MGLLPEARMRAKNEWFRWYRLLPKPGVENERSSGWGLLHKRQRRRCSSSSSSSINRVHKSYCSFEKITLRFYRAIASRARARPHPTHPGNACRARVQPTRQRVGGYSLLCNAKRSQNRVHETITEHSGRGQSTRFSCLRRGDGRGEATAERDAHTRAAHADRGKSSCFTTVRARLAPSPPPQQQRWRPSPVPPQTHSGIMAKQLCAGV